MNKIRTIRIDPTAQTVTEIQVAQENNYIGATIGCGRIEAIQLSPAIDLWIDEEGLLSTDGKDFFVPHNARGNAMNLVVGCGLVTGLNRAGDTVDLPIYATEDLMKMYIAFIPPDNRQRAAEIAEAILDLCDVYVTQEEIMEARDKQAALLTEALKLATVNPFTVNHGNQATPAG